MRSLQTYQSQMFCDQSRQIANDRQLLNGHDGLVFRIGTTFQYDRVRHAPWVRKKRWTEGADCDRAGRCKFELLDYVFSRKGPGKRETNYTNQGGDATEPNDQQCPSFRKLFRGLFPTATTVLSFDRFSKPRFHCATLEQAIAFQMLMSALSARNQR